MIFGVKFQKRVHNLRKREEDLQEGVEIAGIANIA
jgi:hypothetical protein